MVRVFGVAGAEAGLSLKCDFDSVRVSAYIDGGDVVCNSPMWSGAGTVPVKVVDSNGADMTFAHMVFEFYTVPTIMGLMPSIGSVIFFKQSSGSKFLIITFVAPA